MKTKRSRLDSFLKEYLLKQTPSQTREAMEYSLFAGGKRVRPQLLFLVLESYGQDFEKGLETAGALEMIHTYSLIHDDLPCMDDDDLRRGKPTLHKAMGEATALLAGDALLTQAFSLLISSSLPADVKVKLVEKLAEYAGINGMIFGQELDMEDEADLDKIELIQENKTARLIEFALEAGALIAGHPEDIKAWHDIGSLLGKQFQMVDDYLDIISDEQTMQKSLSDQKNEKNTWISIKGLEACKEQIEETRKDILKKIEQLNLPTHELEEFVNSLSSRTF